MERGSARWRIAETRGAGESAFGLTVGLTNVQRAYKLGREKEAASGFRTADSERGREREREGKKWREMKQFRRRLRVQRDGAVLGASSTRIEHRIHREKE